MKSSRLLRALVLISGLCSVSAPAFAGAISTDTWYCGRFEDVGSPLLGGAMQALSVCQTPDPSSGLHGDPGSAPWTVQIGALGAKLLVVDVEISGDRFELFDNGVSIGLTSEPVDGSLDCDPIQPTDPSDPPAVGSVDCALQSDSYSKGMFDLAPGDHSLSGEFLGTNGFGGFAFIVRNNSTVPAPAAGIAFAGIALTALGLRRRSRPLA